MLAQVRQLMVTHPALVGRAEYAHALRHPLRPDDAGLVSAAAGAVRHNRTVPRSRRAGIASGAALLSLAAGTVALLPFRAELSLPSVVLLYLVPVLLAAATGGLWPALGARWPPALVVNWFFVPPYRTLAVDTGDNVVALVVYLLVAAAAGVAVDRTAARAVEAGATGPGRPDAHRPARRGRP